MIQQIECAGEALDALARTLGHRALAPQLWCQKVDDALATIVNAVEAPRV